MKVIWNADGVYIKQIIENLPKPIPHYNTVSTVVRILVAKKFVSYNICGNAHKYFPIVSREKYILFMLNQIIKEYFDNSFEKLLTQLVHKKKLTIREWRDFVKKE